MTGLMRNWIKYCIKSLASITALVITVALCMAAPTRTVTAQSNPPGVSVAAKVTVPASMRSAPFNTDRTLNIPPGFDIAVYARVDGARFMAVAPNNDLLVSQPADGKVVLVRATSGGDPQLFEYATGLRGPHDIVFHAIGDVTYVYISETHQINRFIYKEGDTQSHDREVVVPNLPDRQSVGAYAHQLKNIALDSKHKLYVAIASTCNACVEDTTADPVRGSIYQYDADGKNGRLYAQGIRNAEGLAILPGTDELWIVINNRDNIAYPLNDSTGNYGKIVPGYVDNHPPEEFVRVREGGNYGWPFCNPNPDSPSGLDNMSFDPDYELNKDGKVDCSKMDKIDKGMQAHTAPLGMIFTGGTKMADPYQPGAIVGLHGSWNRTQPIGYKVVYFPWDSTKNALGQQIDLITGWLSEGAQNPWGRPVDIAVDQQGSLFISDDTAGVVYKLSKQS
jgi:glucose/arabinose dehydrogenase